MFKKYLLVSIIFHIVFIIGAGLCSPHPSSQVKPNYFQFVSSATSETTGTGSGLERSEGKMSTLLKRIKLNGTKKALGLERKADKTLSTFQPSEYLKETDGNGVHIEKNFTPVNQDENQMGNAIIKGSDDIQGLNESALRNETSGEVGGSLQDGTIGGNGTARNKIRKKPVKIYDIKPIYPEEARHKGWEGHVRLEVPLDKYGKLGLIKIIQSSGYKIMDDAAVQAVKQWQYLPATENGNPIDWTLRISVPFKLED